MLHNLSGFTEDQIDEFTVVGTSPMVGMKFRPPALGILSSLPLDFPLFALREPGNPHDPNAIAAYVSTEDLLSILSEDQLEALSNNIEGFSFAVQNEDFENNLTDAENWQIGYFPAKGFADKIAPLMDKFGYGVDDDNIMQGKISFSEKNGEPRFSFRMVMYADLLAKYGTKVTE